MKRPHFICFFTLAFLSLSATAYSQTTKIITLKDGSVLKGKVLELKDSIYTVETSTLGTITVPDTDIVSITPPQSVLSEVQINQNDAQKEDIKNQVQQMQGSIMGDKDIMSDVEGLVNNEEVKALLSDPKLLTDVMSMDPNKIQGNSKVQDLMNNPQIQQLMQKIQQKYPAK